MSKVLITETVLRDAHQSLAATRMTTEEMLPILDEMDKVGYYSLEAWGGATFDACMRFLNEDPWERLRTIKDHCKNTKLQMLFRGQNILGYRHYADDVVEYFVQKSIANGIDIIRIFDALNDARNLETAIKATIKEGGHVQAAICYTTSPFHTNEGFAQYAKQLKEMGADSICIKDMSGIMGPQEAYDLVKALKENVKLPIAIHTHCTTGVAPLTLLKSIEAGADIIDCAISSMSGGTSQYSTETMVYSLRQLGYDIDVDDAITKKIADHFVPVQKKGLESGLLDPYVMGTKTDALLYQVPGGMLSNLIAQLKQQNALDKFDAALAEIPAVKADLGHPPLVTPTSQICGVQAVMNVLAGERYKLVSNEVRAYLRGEYGRAPGVVNPDVIKKVLGDVQPSTARFADNLAPAFEATRKELGAKAQSEEDVMSYLVFPQLAEKYFEYRKNPAAAEAAAKAEAEKKAVAVKYSVRRAD